MLYFREPEVEKIKHEINIQNTLDEFIECFFCDKMSCTYANVCVEVS